MISAQIYKQSELANVAKKVLLMKPNIVALEGPMGVGKTAFTKVLAKALDIKDEIVSPTFVLHRSYLGKSGIALNHIDCWRMESYFELEQVGLAKMIEEKSIIVIEWADKFEKEIKRLSNNDVKLIWVRIEYPSTSSGQVVNKNERRISF